MERCENAHASFTVPSVCQRAESLRHFEKSHRSPLTQRDGGEERSAADAPDALFAVLECMSVYKSCIRAVSACTLGQMSVSRAHLLKQTAVALHMWPLFISVALQALRVLTNCVSKLPIFTQAETTYILASTQIRSQAHTQHPSLLALLEHSIFT